MPKIFLVIKLSPGFCSNIFAQQSVNPAPTAECCVVLHFCDVGYNYRHIFQCYELMCFYFPQDAGHIERHTFATSTLTQLCILFKRTFITICRDQVGDDICSEILYNYSCALVPNTWTKSGPIYILIYKIKRCYLKQSGS